MLNKARDVGKVFSTLEMCLVCKPPGLLRGQAFSSSHQVAETFCLPCLAWSCKTPFMAKLHVTQEFLERSAHLTHCNDLIVVLLEAEYA